MKLTITTLTDFECDLEVREDLPLEDFKAVCEVESGIPASDMLVVLEGQPLTDDNQKSLKEHNIKDGDLVVLQHIHQPNQNSSQEFGFNVPDLFSFSSEDDFIEVHNAGSNFSSSSSSESSDNNDDDNGTVPLIMWDMFHNDPKKLSFAKEKYPELAEAFLSGDFEKFSEMVAKTEEELKEQEMLKQILDDESDLETQKQLEEEIRQKNIDDNKKAALEFNPESFRGIKMLLIDCKVNGQLVKAFVDSGCQDTTMSEECAKKCNLTHLIDSQVSGVVIGIGTQRLVGRVHLSPIQIGDAVLTSSIYILENLKVDMLLGLDFLLRHNCVIDLQRKVLIIGSTKTEVRFLSEAEFPIAEYARLIAAGANENTQNEATRSAGNGKADAESVLDQSNNKRGAPSIDSAINKKQKKN
ncbi:unnamed protein product [Orchesella dallaii]|uniref:Ubiquitin-like domain-containing protein n=1 Tax=Orchesella dallaii TaxID=48710 RepID=A0ABP1R3W1_9HEXA